MSDRLCGYCRAPGHRKPECPEVKEQRHLLLTHTPKQRLELMRALAKLGLGVGSMFRGRDYYNDCEYIGTIQNFDFVADCNFIEAKNVRYSKKVRLSTLDIHKDFIYRRIYIRYLHMAAGSTSYRNLALCVTQALHEAVGAPDRDMYRAAFPQDFNLFSPSDVIDYDDEILVRGIAMPKRLRSTNETEYMRGYAPIVIG
jgi:hypothetical protein